MPDTAIARLDEALKRLHESEPSVHAYVHVDEPGARKEALAADGMAAKGPLCGVPFAVKEVIEVAGVPTSGGSKALADHIPARDATVVRRLREAGAVLVGTLASHELTCGLDEPPTRNPFDLACYPGGSSAGAGVAVAVGSASVALGTDAAGSVRIPAAMTGTVGLKPTAGAISAAGVLRQASAPSIDTVGIIAGSVAEVAETFEVISGPDAGDPRTLYAMSETERGAAPARLQGVRIAVLGEKTLAALGDLCPLDPEIDRAFTLAADAARDAGAVLVPVEMPLLAGASAAVSTFFAAELAVAHRDLVNERAKDYHPDIHAMLRDALAMPLSQLRDAVGFRTALRQEVTAAMDDADVQVLMTPTTARVAMPLETFNPAEELGTLIPFTCGFNLTGQPAVSVPCGATANGLPIGLQLVGLTFRDGDLLGIARAFEPNGEGQRGTRSVEPGLSLLYSDRQGRCRKREETDLPMDMRTSTAEAVTNQLRRDLLDGTIAPGARILPKDLAKRFDVSIVPIREALQRLEVENLIVSSPQRATYAADVGLEDLAGVYDLRQILEVELAGRAAAAASSDDHRKCNAALAALLQCTPHSSEFFSAHRAFHWQLLAPAASGVAKRTLERLWQSVDRYIALAAKELPTFSGADYVSTFREEHSGLARAFEAGDSELLRALLAEHLTKTEHRLQRALTVLAPDSAAASKWQPERAAEHGKEPAS